ncbi:FAST kinase domain-containing protein 4 [Parasteatoda tepidariorum]|uniref:FAST kinase domain-containing protein 4 n=1 Tax=Parasteatoda tepidariorum TaxID=114398 RepID=UPI001C720CBB|nr:FAST kinase domain-containing protein 4 [Parasteatoda tepidariorum]XP_042900463.1 FAST kinase domain-containing protein 4 [Parasteatoda tepidariorum]
MSSRMSSILLKRNQYKFIITSLHLRCKFFSSYADTNQQQNLNQTIQVSKRLKPFIGQTVKEILSEVDSKYTTASESITFLKALRIHTMFNKVPPETFTNDPKFNLLCDVFQKNCDSLNLNLLISGLRSLLEVGMPSHSQCVISAETQILNNCSELNTLNLITCLNFQQNFLDSDLQKKVKIALEEELVKKLSQVATPAEVLLLSNIFHSLDKNHSKAVELKIIELVPSLNVHEMCKIIVSFAQHSNRNTAILNAIAFHLRQKKELPDVKETVDILYAFKKLNYVEVRFLPYLLHAAAHEVPKITQPSLISGILVTCGHLKWKNVELLDACTEWIKKNFNACRNREFIAFILATASLYHHNAKTKEVIELILPFITPEKIESSNVLLDVAWSLSIFDMLPKDLLLHVLSAGFYKPLLDVPDPQVQITNKLKLMNLKGVLKVKYPEHIFGCDLYLEPIKLKDSSDIENGRRHVIKVLSNFVPTEKCLCTNQTNDMGIFIDAEFIMDKNKKPLSLAEYGVIAQTPKKSKLLPSGAQRIALLVMFHKDYVQNSGNLTGVNILAAKLLTHLGYAVVQILYDDLIRNRTELQKAKHLMQKITTAIQNTKRGNV